MGKVYVIELPRNSEYKNIIKAYLNPVCSTAGGWYLHILKGDLNTGSCVDLRDDIKRARCFIHIDVYSRCYGIVHADEIIARASAGYSLSDFWGSTASMSSVQQEESVPEPREWDVSVLSSNLRAAAGTGASSAFFAEQEAMAVSTDFDRVYRMYHNARGSHPLRGAAANVVASGDNIIWRDDLTGPRF